jgi:hypothetical protein
MHEAGETSIEVAHKLGESDGNKEKIPSRTEFVIEILEAIILALVAVATAYSAIKRSCGMDTKQSYTLSPTLSI